MAFDIVGEGECEGHDCLQRGNSLRRLVVLLQVEGLLNIPQILLNHLIHCDGFIIEYLSLVGHLANECLGASSPNSH